MKSCLIIPHFETKKIYIKYISSLVIQFLLLHKASMHSEMWAGDYMTNNAYHRDFKAKNYYQESIVAYKKHSYKWNYLNCCS